MDAPQTDSGYPTPRDEELPSSSRSFSPITSTPLRSAERKSLRDHFEGIHNDHRSQDSEEHKSKIIRIIKPYMEMSKEMKRLKRENETLREESMRFSNTSASSPTNTIEIPKLVFEDSKLKNEIKREITQSFVKIEADPTFFEKKLDEMLEKEAKKLTATTYIDIDSQKNDADAQTDENVHEVSLRIELDDLTSRLEVTEREKINLENRLFDYEKSRKMFEENEEKLKKDMEALAEKRGKKIEELQARLTSSRNENLQIRDENQKLVEDIKTHEFEIAEITVKIESIQKEKEDAIKTVEELNRQIEKDNMTRIELENEKKRIVEQTDNEIGLLNEKIREILADEKSKNETLKEQHDVYLATREEIIALKKENEYLTAAQETMIESEMALKRQLSELGAKLKTTENRLEITENRLKSEETTRKSRDVEVERQIEEISRLTEGREEAAELLVEIRKGKEEIDFLRKEVQRAKSVAEAEDRNLTEENRSLKEMFETSEKSHKLRIEELTLESSKHQMEVDFLKQELEKRQKSMEEMMKNAENNMKYYNELRSVNEKLIAEYEEYKKNAEHQFFHEVGEHQQMIEHLQKRLVELETYPGQNLSIQRNSQETQTDSLTSAISARGSQGGSQVSLISEISPRSVISPSGSRIEKLTGKLRELITRDLNSSNCSQFHSEVFRRIVEMLESFGNESSSPIAGASRFYETLTRLLRQFEMEWKQRVESGEEAKKELEEMEEELQNARRQLASADEKLAEEISTHSNVLRQNRVLESELSEMAKQLQRKEEESANRYSMVVGFKTEFDHQKEENDRIINAYEELQKELENEKGLWENEVVGLRQRLEKAEADLQKRERAGLQENDVHHEEISELQNSLRQMTNQSKNLQTKLKNLEKEKDDLLKKRKYDKKTFDELQSSYHIVERKAQHYRDGNRERQKTLDYAMKMIKKLEAQMENVEGKRMVGELYGDIQNKTSQFYDDTSSDKSTPIFQQNTQQQSTSSRRILSNLNQD